MPTVKHKLANLNFEWDTEKHQKVLDKHQISFEEAASIFLDLNEKTFQDLRFDDELRFITIGLSNQARLIAVAWTARSGSIRLITALKATKNHEKQYYGR